MTHVPFDDKKVPGGIRDSLERRQIARYEAAHKPTCDLFYTSNNNPGHPGLSFATEVPWTLEGYIGTDEAKKYGQNLCDEAVERGDLAPNACGFITMIVDHKDNGIKACYTFYRFPAGNMVSA